MLTEGANTEERDAIGRHFKYWENLTQGGRALLVGRTQTSTPDTLGLAIFLSTDEEEARGIANADPAVSEGVFHARVYPYKVALLGNAAAFAPEN